jgi:hypothetical protein
MRDVAGDEESFDPRAGGGVVKDALRIGRARHGVPDRQHRWTPAPRERGDEGNLVAVLVLLVALALLSVVTAAAIVPTFHVATTSQTGEQAVAQANSGLSDALFQLDQMGDQVSSFCLGDPPTSLLDQAGLDLSSCINYSSQEPLPNAPSVKYYVGVTSNHLLPYGVTNEVRLTSEAIVSGQVRKASELVYRAADTFGVFGVGGVTLNGNSTGATIGTGSGNPLTLTPEAVEVGSGPNGTLTCNEGSGNSNFTYVVQDGVVSTCGGTQEATSIEPSLPTFCSSGQLSTALAPCIATDSSCTGCQTVNGSTYCPLPGIGFATQPTVTTAPTPTSQSAIFDCRSPSPSTTTVYIGQTTTSSGKTQCATGTTPSVTLPDDFTAIPPGNYYLNADNVQICPIPGASSSSPSVLTNGPVNLFILPHDCTSTTCAVTPAVSGQSYVCPKSSSTFSLQYGGQMINTYLNSTNTQPYFTVTNGRSGSSKKSVTFSAGDPSYLGVFWGGPGTVTLNFSSSAPGAFSSNIFAPAATVTNSGSAGDYFGSVTSACFIENGSPNLYFIYGQHPPQYELGWSTTQYSINP